MITPEQFQFFADRPAWELKLWVYVQVDGSGSLADMAEIVSHRVGRRRVQPSVSAISQALKRFVDVPGGSVPAKSREKAKKRLPTTPIITWGKEKGWQGIQESDFSGWAAAYPAVDAELALKQMAEWLMSNPAKAKKSNWRGFITRWLTRCQDRGGNRNAASQPGNSRQKSIQAQIESARHGST